MEPVAPSELLAWDFPSPVPSYPEPDSIESFVAASDRLIAELRQRIVELEQQITSGADAFNQIVRLGNQAAEHIIANAHAEAQRIIGEQTSIGPSEPAASEATEVDTRDAEFRRQWEQEASIDERFADKTFFEQEYHEPSRTWILADTA